MSQHSAVIYRPGVFVSNEICQLIWKTSDFSQVVRDLRAQNPEAAAECLVIAQGAMAHEKNPYVGVSKSASTAQEPSGLTYVTTKEAADHLGMGDAGVRCACREERLRSRCIDGRWQVERDDLDRFANERKLRRG